MDESRLDQMLDAVKPTTVPDTAIQLAPISAKLADALERMRDVTAGDLMADVALDDIETALRIHATLTWYLARWHDYQTGPVGYGFAAGSTRRWLDVMTAFRAAMEL